MGVGASLLGVFLAGCSLPIKPQQAQTTYRLNPPALASMPLMGTGSTPPGAFLIEVRPIEAAKGFETPNMMYSTQAQLLEPYRESRWLAAPAALLTDSMEQVLARQPWVAGVVRNSARAPVMVSISCDLTRLEHDISDNVGHTHLVMSCLWLNPTTRSVLAHWRFDQTQAMPENNAAQFAAASQILVNDALNQLVEKTRALLASERLVP
jgi:cholesterol transport system auxiliary component